MHIGDGVLPVLVRTLPLADLDDAAIAVLGGHHGLAFGDRIADRLLAIDILAGRTGVGHDQAVPVVGRGYDDGVDILVVKQLAIVAEQFGRLSSKVWARHRLQLAGAL